VKSFATILGLILAVCVLVWVIGFLSGILWFLIKVIIAIALLYGILQWYRSRK
jgi:hypothetical protein